MLRIKTAENQQLIQPATVLLGFGPSKAKLMVRTKDQKIFAKETQADLFGSEAAPAYRPDPDKVRARLHKILAEARAADKFPWGPGRVSLYRTIFPQMTGCLPEDEGAQLRFQFEEELARLEAA
jgi:hypothetical protein